MRITNKIMQKNNLSNINTNKVYQDKLSTQMSTQKKVNRPSDDPVVAIRALRLRSSVTEITQYYSKNIPDADSWLNVTEDALKNLTSIVTDMITNCTKGANGDLTNDDRQIILEQLKALGDEVYSTADADYAGRYVFSGYRTDTPVGFQEKSTDNFTITEQLTKEAIDDVTHVNTVNLLDINVSNFNDSAFSGLDETKISASTVHRIRLGYNKLNDDADVEMPEIQAYKRDSAGNLIKYKVDANGEFEKDADGKLIEDAGGEAAFASYTATLKLNSYETDADGKNPYELAASTPDAVIYVPDTGELLLGQDVYDALMGTKDEVSTSTDESEIRVTYQKNSWNKGDLNPQHYYYCRNLTKDIEYNSDYLTGEPERQAIEYDVGFNQTIRINSTAGECFSTGIGREVSDVVSALQEVINIQSVKEAIEKKLEDETLSDADKKKLQTQLDAANKAFTLAKDRSQTAFENGITAFQGYLDDANICITETGTRSKKLELIENRMQNQKTTFETLKSENEDVDITEVAIQLSSAELTYEAALMATGKVMQTTLLNFI